jgi:hypothetical protein
MLFKRKIGLMAAVSLGVTMQALPASASNDDGCWSGKYSGGSCVQYSTYEKNNKTYFKITNKCDRRLYIKWCADKKCGADGLPGGATRTRYEFVTNAVTSVKGVGSTKGSQDWVCAGKVSNWNDD